MAVTVISFSRIIFDVSNTDHFGTFKVSLTRQGLSNEHQYHNFEVLTVMVGVQETASFRVDADLLDDFRCISKLAW